MKLLEDAWVPIGNQQTITLQTLLTQAGDWQISLPRDDMEMACLQLLICLVQSLFTPPDGETLKQRIKIPLTPDQYQAGIDGKESWFDLSHPDQPFMQTRGVKSKELTPMAKLFAGLDSSTSSVFVNEPGLADRLCPSCTSIGLYNQANNAPSFGGGFKGSLRGGTPISTLVLDKLQETKDGLRQRIWRNVLPEDTLNTFMPWYMETRQQKPNWVDPIKVGDVIHNNQIGLLRGLFWQPAHIELAEDEEGGLCDCCGRASNSLYIGFKKEKFVYEIKYTWPHPHSPRNYKLTRGERTEKFASFTTTAPAWTQLTGFIIEDGDARSGHIPAPVVTQAKKMSSRQNPFHLMVGGYRNNQAAILERRHDLFAIAKGWEDHNEDLVRIVNDGKVYVDTLRKKLYGVSKKANINLHDTAESLFYSHTESLVHTMLRDMDFEESKKAFDEYHQKLAKISMAIFDQLVQPYREIPSMIRTLAIAERSLKKAFKELREEG